MPLRAYWKGYLKLSLVSCAVALYAATSTNERVRFHMLNRATGNRLKQQYIDSVTEEVVPPEVRTRGYAADKDDYVVVENDEIDAVELESNHTISIDRFVDEDSVDPIYFDNFYFLAPSDRVALEAFAVIREAMRASKTVGLARVVFGHRERVVMIAPRGKGILATSLRYPYEVRSEASVFADIADVDIDTETLKLATHIIETKRGAFEPSSFEDRYENALIEFVQSKRAGRPTTPPREAARPTNVVNLMDALKRSLETAGSATPSKSKPKAVNADKRAVGKGPSKGSKPRKTG